MTRFVENEKLSDFKLFFNSIPYPYVVLKPKPPLFIIVAVNDAYLRATGKKRDDIIGNDVFNVFKIHPPDSEVTDGQDLRLSLERVFHEGVKDIMGIQKHEIPSFEEDHPKSVIRYWNSTNIPVFNETNSLEFIIHHAEDVTEFVQAFEQSTKVSTQIQKYNPRSQGFRKEILQSHLQLKQSNLRLNESDSTDYRVKPVNMRELNALIKNNLHVVLHNLWQASEKELQSIKFAIEISTIIAITDKQGVITYANDAFCNISQFSRKELLGQTHRIVNSGFHDQSFFQEMWVTIGEGKVWHDEIQNKAKDGTFYWVDTWIVPFLDDEGKPFQYVAIRHDITPQKLAEEKCHKLAVQLEKRVLERTSELAVINFSLQQEIEDRKHSEAIALEAKHQAEEANRLKTQVLSFVSHDFKNPLCSINRFVEILKNEKSSTLSDKQKEMVDCIDKGVNLLFGMVRNILDRSRLEQGQVIPSMEKIEIRKFITQLIPMFNGMAMELNVSIDIDIQDELEEIEADPVHLRQILINLVSNAIKYNHPKGEVFLKVFKTDNSQYAIFEVHDTGKGISQSEIQKLFTAYYRSVDFSETQQIEGTGLGLAFIKKLITLHGGTIHVESEVGQGSTFKVTLPLISNLKFQLVDNHILD